MYSLCGNIRFDYYLKTRDMRVRLISCLPDSNRNSAGEFVQVKGNWFTDELPCPFSLRDIGRYREPSFALSLHLLISCSRIELISLFFVDLLQNQKGSNQISKLYTYEILILYLDQKSLFIRTDSSKHLT